MQFNSLALTFVSQKVSEGCGPFKRLVRPGFVVLVRETHEVELLLEEKTSKASLELLGPGEEGQNSRSSPGSQCEEHLTVLYFTIRSSIVSKEAENLSRLTSPDK